MVMMTTVTLLVSRPAIEWVDNNQKQVFVDSHSFEDDDGGCESSSKHILFRLINSSWSWVSTELAYATASVHSVLFFIYRRLRNLLWENIFGLERVRRQCNRLRMIVPVLTRLSFCAASSTTPQKPETLNNKRTWRNGVGFLLERLQNF